MSCRTTLQFRISIEPQPDPEDLIREEEEEDTVWTFQKKLQKVNF